ncbi:MAG: hypothetical protein ABI378_05165 [Chitinophagaceae bacterium]
MDWRKFVQKKACPTTLPLRANNLYLDSIQTSPDTEYAKQPDDHTNHYYDVENSLDLAIHGNVAVDQIEHDTSDNEDDNDSK